MTYPRLLLLGAGLTSCLHGVHGLEAKELLSYSFGRTTFQPRVSLGSTYSDNITYNNRVPLSDVTLSIAPGIGFLYGKPGENVLTAGYQLEQIFYMDHNEFDALNHSFQMTGHVEGSKLAYDGLVSIQHLSTLLGGSLSDPLLFGTSLQADRFVYRTTHMLDYTLSEKTGVYAGPSFDALDYEDGTPLFDYNTLFGVAGFRYVLTPKTELFGEMRYGQSGVDPNRSIDPKGPSSTFVGGSVGAKFDFSARITGIVKVGYEARSYSNDNDAPSEPVVSADISYKLSPKTSLSLNYSRFLSASLQAVSETAVVDSFGLTATQQIGNTGKFGANAGLAYQTTSYQSNVTTARDDERIFGSIGFFYKFQLWLKAGLTYSHTQYTSSLPTVLEYTENKVALALSVGY